MRKIEVEIGARFGRLVVREGGHYVQYGGRSRTAVLCDCDCGADAIIATANLRGGNSKSCGCGKREAAMRNVHRNGQRAVERLTTHGLSKHPHYNRWYNMIQRCQHSQHHAYVHYGRRGIRVAPEWQNPATFLAYVDTVLGSCPPRYSLDRIDNEGHYEPGNLRWASWSEQARNRRKRRTST